MTVSYQYDVASSTSGGFTRLLFKWKGSLYKLIYRELALFCATYAVMSAFYRYTFTQNQKRSFEQVAFYCDTYMNYIPLSFILGFYVSFVASRWWQQYMAIPWPDKILHAVALYVGGNDIKGRMIRRTMVRYLNLSLVLVLRSISSAVKKRFPTLDHLVEAGFITSDELRLFNMVPNKEFNTYWIPCTWFTALIRDAKSQKRFSDPIGVKLIMEEFCEFRQKCGMLWSYDWVSIPLVYTQMFLEYRAKCGMLWIHDTVTVPLVYTQVVTIATYSFFMAAIVGRQFVDKSPIPYKRMIDLYVPFFTLLQFFFYMGLLKVAEQLINPFGDDDEDFELNWIIDRHMKVSYLIVDTLIMRAPPLTKDIFFDEESPELPYTEASAGFKKKTYRGSVADMIVPEEKQMLILPDIDEGDEEESDNKQYKKVSKIIQPSHKPCGLEYHVAVSGVASNGRSLSVPEVQKIASSTAISPRGSSSRSVPSTGIQVRRSGTPGSKGVVGSNQNLLSPDSLSIGERSISGGLQDGSPSPYRKDIKNNKSDGELDFLYLPFKDVCLDIEEGHNDVKHKGRNVFKMPASWQAKLAVKRKPVIKWKPYQRPEARGIDPLGDFDASLNEEIAPGIFEDECAFMWRTIDEDQDDSTKSPMYASALSVESHSFIANANTQGKVLSYYSEIKPSSLKLNPSDPKTFNILFPSKISHKKIIKTQRVKRTRYKLRGRTRMSGELYPSSNLCNSLPYLPHNKCGCNAISNNFLRSLSEASLFLDAFTSRMSESHSENIFTNTGQDLPSDIQSISHDQQMNSFNNTNR